LQRKFHVPQPDHISALPVADREALDEDLRGLFALCIEKLGIVPNILRASSLRPQKLRNFVAIYNELMLARSGVSKLSTSLSRAPKGVDGQARPRRMSEEIGPPISLTGPACGVSL
jgi:hypothetical protein